MTLNPARLRALFACLTAVSGAGCLFGAETEVRYLSGTGPDDTVEWDFFCTDGRKSREWLKIAVPSCWEQQGFGTYSYGRDRGTAENPLPNEQGMYRHSFDVPAAWREKTVHIVFDGAMTDTSVWINGESAGPTHQGAFYRFHYDITDLLKFGASNLLEVTVAKVSSNKSVNEAEREADYWVFGGIFRPVWLEAHPRQFIDWTAIDAQADGRFLAELHLGAPAAAAGRVTARVLDADDNLVGGPFAAPVAAGDTRAVVRGKFDEIKTWTAETPDLYQVRFALVGPDLRSGPSAGRPNEARTRGAALHTVTEQFGFRTLEVRENDGVYLNGARIVLKGVNRHCFWPETGRTVSREQSYRDARLIKEANMNAVRMSHYPPDKHFLEACDELGLYVLDELAGWQAAYDTRTGRRLIGELVRRDVNHPSILFWDNGNEGGWNTDIDDEFAKWDPQNRPVLHPWAVHGGIDTNHYEDYASTVNLSAGPQIFMPTEMLHGLYDGGIGAGFRDYWDVMGESPTVAGGFFWVWADESVVRTDQNGRFDSAGNQAPDGIVGPHREKEGSFFTVKEIWSPVQIPLSARQAAPPPRSLPVKNNYDFTNLDQVTFTWRLLRFAPAGSGGAGGEVIAEGEFAGPSVAPHGEGTLELPLPADWGPATALHLKATGHDGRDLVTWSWKLDAAAMARRPPGETSVQPVVRDDGDHLAVRAGINEVRFDRRTGWLAGYARDGQRFSLGEGVQFIAAIADERLPGFHAPRSVAGVPTRFEDLSGNTTLLEIDRRIEGSSAVVEARYDGPLRVARWTLEPAGALRLDYEYEYEGKVDFVGVFLRYPEPRVRAKRWLGQGPYRVWQNRLEGGVFDLHEVAYNDPIPGEVYAYPEFKGFFRDWHWLTLETDEGAIVIENLSGVPFFGLYQPKTGVGGLLQLPDVGLAFLDAIPAQRTKFLLASRLGPQGQPHQAGGVKRGTIVFRFERNEQ